MNVCNDLNSNTIVNVNVFKSCTITFATTKKKQFYTQLYVFWKMSQYTGADEEYKSKVVFLNIYSNQVTMQLSK